MRTLSLSMVNPHRPQGGSDRLPGLSERDRCRWYLTALKVRVISPAAGGRKQAEIYIERLKFELFWNPEKKVEKKQKIVLLFTRGKPLHFFCEGHVFLLGFRKEKVLEPLDFLPYKNDKTAKQLENKFTTSSWYNKLIFFSPNNQ